MGIKRYELTKEQGDRIKPWNALDCPKRHPVAGIAGGLWPLAVSVCPICQMTGFLLAAPLRDFVARVVVVSTFLKTYIIVFYGNFV